MTKGWMRLAVVTFSMFAAHAALAQAPAGAPAGAGGICRDGSYSMAATKAGACRGHKGVQSWYLAETEKPAKGTKSNGAMPMAPKPAPSPINSPQAAPAPTPMQQPTPRATPAAPAGPMNAPMAPMAPATKSSTAKTPRGPMSQKPQQPGGGPGLVWVNTESKVYHCMGDEFYGRTKQGAYMSENDAKSKGARGDRGKNCAGK